MKTLVNKNNPQIRIIAPEIGSYEGFYTLSDKDSHYLFKMETWTLVEEEPEKIYYKMLDNKANCPFDKGNCNYCTVQFCGAREECQIETRSTADLEQTAIDHAFQRVDGDISRFDLQKAFKAGAEWQKKQDEDGKALLYVNDHAYKKGFKDGKIEAMLNNELIWQDVKQIVNIADKEIEGLYRPFDKFPTEQSYYKEILKKYKEQKNK